MKFAAVAFLVLLVAPAAHAGSTVVKASPIEKVVQLLGDLETKIMAEGKAAQKAYDEYSEWCEDRAKNVDFEIKTGSAEVEELEASIEKDTATITALSAKVEQLGLDLGYDEMDLKAANMIRAKEAKDFAAEEKELVDIVDSLQRAIAILEREMSKGGAAASMLQARGTTAIVQAFNSMVQASVFSSADAARLTSLVQNAQQEADSDADDQEPGAPDPAVYESHSGTILDTLESLLEKAQGQLAKARTAETNSLHEYEMLKQSITDEIRFGQQDMAKAKQAIAEASESKATAEGDLAVTTKDLEEDKKTKETLHHDCMTAAEDFEEASKSRAEELKALAEAKKVLQDHTGAAGELSYGLTQTSFLQVGAERLASTVDLANFEAIRLVRDLAAKEHSTALAQLAARMSEAARFSEATGADPFAKVKGLITDMINRLEADAQADASHKAYCDKETGESIAKKDEKMAEVRKLTAKIDQMSAQSAKLKDEVATLQKELAGIHAAQAEMDKLRSEEHTAYVKNKADMEEGLQGVKTALKVLNDYYAKEGTAHEAATGAGTGIIGLLEVVESDFTKDLAGMVAAEEAAQADYEATTKANEIEIAAKEQDVKYKAKESAGLDKSVAEHSSDRAGVQEELDAILEYLGKLAKMCTTKSMPYEERKARREAEIAGLKEALAILEGEAMLLQRSSARALRGAPAGHH